MSERANWELRNIGLVNWYLFGAQDIQVRGKIALTGPNGAGKSSILDAIQTVLTGRSGRHLQLNSLVQTDRAGRRTVRDYCLGALDDGDEGIQFVRDQAISYVMVGFRRTDTGKEVTAGLCFASRADTPDEDVLSRFLVEGRILTVSDLAKTGEDKDGEWSEARPWKEVAAALRAESGIVLSTESGPEVFVKSLCRMIGPSHGSVDPHKFLRNLRNAVAFKPVGNTTDFVRNFILDAQPLNLKALRESIARFKEIQRKVTELKARIAEVDDLSVRAERIRTRQRTLALHRLTAAQGRLHLAATGLKAADREKSDTEKALSAAVAGMKELEDRAAACERTAAECRAEIAGSEWSRTLERLDQRQEVLEVRAKSLRDRLAPLEKLIRDASEIAPLIEPFSLPGAKALAALPAADRDEPARTALSLPNSKLLRDLEAAARKVEAAADDSKLKISAAESQLAALDANLARVKSGKRLIGGATQSLLGALNRAGISATPLCDLVTGVDTGWQRTVEAIMGDGREALIVDPKRYEAALKIYRALGLHGAQIVNTTKSKGTKAPRKGTLATVVGATDEHARAFVDFRLGNVVMVGDEAGLAREDSAATADLMYAAGRTVRKMRAPAHLILGGASEGAEDAIAEEAEEIRSGLASERQRMEQLRSCLRSVNRVLEAIYAIDPESAGATMAELDAVDDEHSKVSVEAHQVRGQGDGRLQERLDSAVAALAAANQTLRKAVEKRAMLTERLDAREKTSLERQAAVESMRETASVLLEASREMIGQEEEQFAMWWLGEAIPDAPEFGRKTEDAEADQAVGKPKDETLGARLDHLEGYIITYHAKRIDNDRPNLVVRVGSYVNIHGIDRPVFLDDSTADLDDRFQTAVQWVRDEFTTLNNHVLKEYEGKSAEAYEEAVVHFKGDFVGKMRGAFEAIQGRLRELNRQLAKRDFHGLTYRFDRKDAAAYRDMIALVEASEDPAFDMPAHGGTVALNDRVGRALKRLEEMALDPAADIADLEDPRLYFEFDISMDKDGIERTTMSKRLGTGSGGQVQVPYYVAICAALAATCYPDRHGLDGGMALSIFDEAFNRMDTAVISEVLNFMGDVGLQPFIAAPDKERATFMQFVDTVIGMSRTGTAVSLDIQYVKEHAHRRFREENPSLYGFDKFQKARTEPAAAE